METAAEMIMDSPCCHFAQREKIHVESVLAARGLRAVPRINAKKKIEGHWPRKFRCASEASFVRIVGARQLLVSGVNCLGIKVAGTIGQALSRFTQGSDDLIPLPSDFLVVLLPRSSNTFEHFFKTGLTVSIFGRKISPADKRL